MYAYHYINLAWPCNIYFIIPNKFTCWQYTVTCMACTSKRWSYCFKWCHACA